MQDFLQNNVNRPLEFIILLGAGVTALFFLSKKLRQGFGKIKDFIKGWLLTVTRWRTLEGIADEFKSDSGATLKDAINRIEKRQVLTYEQLQRRNGVDDLFKKEVLHRLDDIESHQERHHDKIKQNGKDIAEVKEKV